MKAAITTIALAAVAVVAIGCQSLWPTRYEETDGSVTYLFQQDAELLVQQDNARVGRNEGHIRDAETQKAWMLSLLGAAGIPTGLLALFKKRPGDFTPEEFQQALRDAGVTIPGDKAAKAA